MLKTVQEIWEESQITLPLKDFPEREEELLLIFLEILQVNRHELTLYKNQQLTLQQQQQFYHIINERKTFKPLAYILGFQYFYGEKFPVSPETLIPRFDTEILVHSVTKYFSKQEKFKILDICTGTGVIALTLAKLFPQATIRGIDIVSQPFLQSQRSLNLLEDRISFIEQDFLNSNLWKGTWDCIVSNPPYLDEQDMSKLDKQVYHYEPHSALLAKEEGLQFYRLIAEYCDSHLTLGGYLFLEVDHKHEKIFSFFDNSIYELPILINDLSNLPRVLIIKKKLSS